MGSPEKAVQQERNVIRQLSDRAFEGQCGAVCGLPASLSASLYREVGGENARQLHRV